MSLLLLIANSKRLYGSLQRRETNIPGNQPEIEHYRFTANGNLQAYMYENLLYVHYGYDGGTTRTYKYSFDLNPNWVNGRLENVSFNPRTAMFYPNSYLNFNSNGYYTKHYYNGTERIASRLGDQNLPINVNDPDLQDRKDWQDSLIRKNVTEITGYQFLEPGQEQDPDDPKPVFELPQVGLTNLIPNTSSVYYYHPNHLGSTCYVTDGNASVVQGFLYAPFGEITNEHNSGWQSGTLPKYSFNAKELDEETGMYYYEARYYAPPTFTSRDPLFEKYPTFTPYAYCANNPVKYVDPSGRDWYLPENSTTPVWDKKVTKKNCPENATYLGAEGCTYDGTTITHYKKNGETQQYLVSNSTHKSGFTFPIGSITDSYKFGYAQFGSNRAKGKRKHAGCDLYADVGTPVFAVSQGTVFEKAYFYEGTYSIAINHGTFSARYCELIPSFNIQLGMQVSEGDFLGMIGKLSSISQSMLHFEMYDNTQKGSLTNTTNGSPFMRRLDLIDPTSFLDGIRLAEKKVSIKCNYR